MVNLSGVVPTRDGANRLHSLLPGLCELCDEVVVLVDSLTVDDTFEVARRYTDRVFVFPHDDMFRNMQVAAFERARGQWILRMADDETLSPQWARARVDALTADKRITQIGTPTRWLVGEGLAVAAGIWYPHYEPRLYRNIGSLATYGTSPHDMMTIAGEERRVADLIVYHWNFVLKDRAAREERVAFYHRTDPSFDCAEYYLYEDSHHEIAAFDDVALPAQDPALPGPPEDSPFTIDMIPSELSAKMIAGERYSAKLEIANRSNRTLEAPSKLLNESNFAITYNWLSGDGETVVRFGQEEQPLFATLEPLAIRSAYLLIRAPSEAGAYRLQFDLLERGVTWFSQSFASGNHPSVAVEVIALEAPLPLASR